MKKIIKSLIAVSIFASSAAMAEISIIVNSANNSNIDKSTISNIFLGKDKSMKPINLNGTSKDEFYEKITGKSPSQVKSYWSGLVFTGKGSPPKDIDTPQSVIDYVKSNPDGIGYIPKENVDSSVKVILDI